MKVSIFQDYETLCQEAANIICNSINENPKLNLGLATGGTPLGVYQALIDKYSMDACDFSQVTSFNLDEYVGIDPNNLNSYTYYMQKHFFQYVNIPVSNQHIPQGNAKDLPKACQDYDHKLHMMGGIDLQLLGLGTNGHIGFNEPGTNPYQRTHVVQLAEQTILDNSRFFESIDEVPREAITMGLSSILESRQIVLLVSGSGKAEAVQKLMHNGVTKNFPASFLKEHPNVKLLLDKDAASFI